MDKRINWVTWFRNMFKEFLVESVSKPQYEVADIYECSKTGLIKVVVKLSPRHILEKNINEIIIDNDLIEGFDKKTIRALTYLATAEQFKPDCSIVSQELTDEIDGYILSIKAKNNMTIKKSPSEVTKDKILLARLSPLDANRVGYLAGIKETVKEYQLKQ